MFQLTSAIVLLWLYDFDDDERQRRTKLRTTHTEPQSTKRISINNSRLLSFIGSYPNLVSKTVLPTKMTEKKSLEIESLQSLSGEERKLSLLFTKYLQDESKLCSFEECLNRMAREI